VSHLFQNIGISEIIVVAIVLVILFGGKKLPELAKGLAQAIKEFRNAFHGENEKDEKKEKTDE
jgi:sec-independent protein translocase protein TatA